MRKLFGLLFGLALGASSVFAQTNTGTVPIHTIPIGKGAGVTGWANTGTGTFGSVLTSNGASTDPSWQSATGGAVGTAFLAPVALATTGNVTLSGEQTIDGVLTSTTRLLAKSQSTASQNGCYVTAAGAWTRCVDFNVTGSVSKGTKVVVTGGTINANSTFQIITANPVTIGSTITFERDGSVIPASPFGLTGNGTTDDTAAAQAAINATPANSAVFFPCGTFLINSVTLTFPSNIRITGSGTCTIFKQGASLALNAPFGVLWPSNPTRTLLTNSDYTSGNTNVQIDHITFDTTGAPAGSTHALLCYKCTDVLVDAIKGTGAGVAGGAGDLTAFVQSTRYTITNSSGFELSNACFDQWQGSSYFTIANNTCDNVGTGGGAITVTGINTDGSSGTTSSHGIIANNKITRATGGGIWIQGGVTGGVTGSVTDVVVTNNVIDTALLGIRASEASYITIKANNIQNTTSFGIAAVGEAATGGGTNLVVTDNTLRAVGTGGSIEAIALSNNSSSGVIAGNRISSTGSSYTYCITLGTAARGNQVYGNSCDTGATGRISDANTTAPLNTIQDASGGKPTCAATGNGSGGSPGCAVSAGSTIYVGRVLMTTGSGSTAATGTIVLTFNSVLGIVSASCLFQPSNAGSSWDPDTTLINTAQSNTANTVFWRNAAVALTVSTTYGFLYHCQGY